MKNNGIQLEKTIRLIEETFKDSDNTRIFSNYRIPNESGNNREIDVFIVSKINDFEINIAIECKDYKKKVSVEKIEAFQSKCDRIKQINKKIFISTNGFQSDAINSAKYYGIELFTAEELNASALKKILPIKQLKPQILPQISNVVLTLDADEEKLSKIQTTFNGIIFSTDNDELEINLTHQIFETIDKFKREVFAQSLIHWMKMEKIENEEITFPINLNLNFNRHYIKGNNDEKIILQNCNFDILVKFDFIFPELSGRSLKHFDGKIKANSLDVKMNDNLESHMIIKNDSEIDIYITENKEIRKLETLLKYDPKTKQFTKPE